MQYTESIILPHTSPNMNKNQLIHRTRPWPVTSFPNTTKTIGSCCFGDANCMEQLLVHCATAIEANDATLAQQILWVLNNIAPPDGDSNQRLSSAFLRALIARAAKIGCCKLLTAMAANVGTNHLSLTTHSFSIIELASFVDLTPWHRFGFTAANAAILEAVEGFSTVHVVDLSLTHCLQIPTLIESISTRPDPPFVKLTVAAAASSENTPLPLDLSYEELGAKLLNFARSRNVMMEFKVVLTSPSDGFSSLIQQLCMMQEHDRHHHHHHHHGEALVINCHMMLHHIPEEETLIETPSGFGSYRDMFLKAMRGLDPTVVVLVEEDADFTSSDLVCRLRSAFNYLWIPYDTVDTFLPRGSKQRQWYEADICRKIENVIAYEGVQRVERLEPRGRWVQRMRGARFSSVAFGEDAVSEVKGMLNEHAAGWGMKRDEEDHHLVLTWKGHSVVFASTWLPV